jgi:hypothetical protein
VRIFDRKTRTRRTLGSHQIRVFHRRSEQLVSREARRKLEKALVHVLGAEASPEAALTVEKHRPSRLTVAGLRCHSPLIKVSKPHRKPTTVARKNSNSGEPPLSVVTCRCERERAPPPAEASRLSRWIGDERPRLEAEKPIRFV